MLARNVLRSCRSGVKKIRTVPVNSRLSAGVATRAFATGLTTQGGKLPFDQSLKVDSRQIDPKALLEDARKTLAEEPGEGEDEFAVYLYEVLGNACEKVMVEGGKITVYTNPENIKTVLSFLKNHTMTQCKVLTDLTAVDYPMREERFEVVYMLLSLRYNNRIHVKVNVDDFDGVPSVSEIFPSANWCEREVWDMFGVFFHGHPDLRRILTDYGFEGHPMRKDFPLTGFVECRYDEIKKRVITEPLQTALDGRVFDFKSPWDNSAQGPMLKLQSTIEKKEAEAAAAAAAAAAEKEAEKKN
mmetsp:Transcript_11732/g.13499  ORF Transcript_11732/g.13499 Transcript_11732/m.13499 type:complete len:300 (-) Transcript_11732:534-1433(-)